METVMADTVSDMQPCGCHVTTDAEDRSTARLCTPHFEEMKALIKRFGLKPGKVPATEIRADSAGGDA